MVKDRMMAVLGEEQLLLPTLIGDALGANDRVKYLLALLQTACAAADGAAEAPSMRDDRIASGVEDERLDRVVSESGREPGGRYRLPGAERIVNQAWDEVHTMLAPLAAANVAAAQTLERRAHDLRPAIEVDGEEIGRDAIARLTSGSRGGADTMHLIVMDAHRELNALQARIATESVDGARAHDIEPGDRTLIRAFMRGLHATERLRFDHPGLGTTATRAGDALVLQNDLGTTDAHVVILRISGRTVTISYTDVHLARLLFFQDMLDGRRVSWEDTRSRSDPSLDDGMFHATRGRFEAVSQDELERFLEHAGSRLVFIIDWNRARKRLRRLVGRRAALALLRWAADEGYGQIAFLRAGADGLVYDALEFAGGRVARAGESFQDVLGAAAAEEYLRAVLRICAEGLLADKPVSLVQDEVRAELTRYLRSAQQELHALALRHAELSVEIAEAAGDGLEHALAGEADACRAVAARARDLEHEADALVTRARTAAARAPDDLGPMLALIEAADDIADSGEDAAFYATLLPSGPPEGATRAQVRRMGRLVLSAARDYLRAVQLSADLRRGGPREDMDAFLATAHAAIELEHDTDEAQRAVHQALVAEAEGWGPSLFVVVELTDAFEEASDALMHSAHLLREQTLTRVVGSAGAGRRTPQAVQQPRPATVTPSASEHVYVVGDASLPIPDPATIGAKAHGLARIERAGLRVPEAIVLKTSLARAAREPGGLDEHRLGETLAAAVESLESRSGLRLGSLRRPLILSVRSGAPVSMPGMLETVLDVGLSDQTVRGLIAMTGNPRMAWDSYRRLVESFATVVEQCPHEPFERALQEALQTPGVRGPRELGARTLEELARGNLVRFADATGRPFPQDPTEQLLAAVEAVLRSWDAPKAQEYRRLHRVPDELGTAVIVQRMVFGNAGGLSGAGVGFTRDPALGTRSLYIDFMLGAQGEDIVGGRSRVDGDGDLGAVPRDLRAEIERVCPRLEREFGDVQEFELTVEDGELYLLQARAAKRTPWAALQIAVDLVHEGRISEETALARIAELDLDAIRRVRVGPSGAAQRLARAVPAGIGVATGPLALDGEAVDRLALDGVAPVLVRPGVETEDVAAIARSAGVLTAAGGRTSHAAVVARELGKPCLVGCGELELDLVARTARIGGRVLAEGETLTLDAESGVVYAGAPAVVEERPTAALEEIARWRERAAEGERQASAAGVTAAR